MTWASEWTAAYVGGVWQRASGEGPATGVVDQRTVRA